MDSKDGLVARVWSDSGPATVTQYTVDIRDIYTTWTGGAQVKQPYSFEGIKWPTFDFRVSTAKDALPAYRVIAGKRGPGWCDE